MIKSEAPRRKRRKYASAALLLCCLAAQGCSDPGLVSLPAYSTLSTDLTPGLQDQLVTYVGSYDVFTVFRPSSNGAGQQGLSNTAE